MCPGVPHFHNIVTNQRKSLCILVFYTQCMSISYLFLTYYDLFIYFLYFIYKKTILFFNTYEM